jgi:ribosome-associated translation inhibitor RaiA
MALQMNISETAKTFVKTSFGVIKKEDSVVSVSNAYIKVDSISGNKNRIDFTVSFSENDAVLTAKSYDFKPDLDGDNFIKQAYLYLKTLPEFESATDA